MHVLCDSMGGGSWKFAPSFLQTLSPWPFPSADLDVSPFSVINYSLKYDYMLTLMSPSSKSLNLGGDVLGTPDTYT